MYTCMGEWAGNTFGSRPWLKTDLARSQKRSASGSPLRCSGDLIHFSVACSLYHTLISPHASSLLSYMMMQHVTLVWNHRRGLSGCWSLPPFGKQWRRKKYHQLHTHTHSLPERSTETRQQRPQSPCLSGRWCWRGYWSSVQHKVKRDLNLKSVLIIRRHPALLRLYIRLCSKWTVQPWQPFVNHPILPRKDNQSEWHGEGVSRILSVMQRSRPAGARSASGVVCELLWPWLQLSLNLALRTDQAALLTALFA